MFCIRLPRPQTSFAIREFARVRSPTIATQVWKPSLPNMLPGDEGRVILTDCVKTIVCCSRGKIQDKAVANTAKHFMGQRNCVYFGKRWEAPYSHPRNVLSVLISFCTTSLHNVPARRTLETRPVDVIESHYEFLCFSFCYTMFPVFSFHKIVFLLVNYWKYAVIFILRIISFCVFPALYQKYGSFK